ncbi:hypothetical protein LY76DRAFT_106538 [Colletotrichum caudatum]|nr:hypothetical protein LY76DRAFT_106538 [Colletotrichum caudatum]
MPKGRAREARRGAARRVTVSYAGGRGGSCSNLSFFPLILSSLFFGGGGEGGDLLYFLFLSQLGRFQSLLQRVVSRITCVMPCFSFFLFFGFARITCSQLLLSCPRQSCPESYPQSYL